MSVLSTMSPHQEIYSIDEAFLLFQDIPKTSDMKSIKETVFRWTGIPVSIGIAPTKTLAKLANRYAKNRMPEVGFFYLNDPEIQKEVLSQTPVEDIWGIGRQSGILLNRAGIRTALELAEADDNWIKSRLSVVGLRTVWELRGISCLALEEVSPPKKSIICSRSFGKDIYKESEIAEALSDYVSSAVEKLRKQGSVASFLEVFLHTDRFKDRFYGNTASMTLPQPTDYTPELISHAKKGLHRIFKDGYAYKKVGVTLGGIVSNKSFQQDLFVENTVKTEKQNNIMSMIDRVNGKYGKGKLKLAAQGVSLSSSWKIQSKKRTQRFMTCWDEILKIKI